MSIDQIANKILLTNAEVAEILRTNTSTIRKRIQHGMYQGLYQKEGKYTLWNKSKLFAYLGIAA